MDSSDSIILNKTILHHFNFKPVVSWDIYIDIFDILFLLVCLIWNLTIHTLYLTLKNFTILQDMFKLRLQVSTMTYISEVDIIVMTWATAGIRLIIIWTNMRQEQSQYGVMYRIKENMRLTTLMALTTFGPFVITII